MMAVGPLDFRLTVWSFTDHLGKGSITNVQGLPKNGRFEGLDCQVGKLCRANSQVFARGEGMTAERLQEFLWQELFLDPSQWWDNRRTKKTPRHPDFRHKKFKDALWVDNLSKPAWVDAQLAMWDGQMDAGTRNPRGEFLCTSVEGGSYDVAMCRKLCEIGQVTDAIDALHHFVQQGCRIPNNLFYLVLKRCTAQKDLVLGRRVHALTVTSGYESDAFVANHLICMYSSHGSLVEAMQVFSKVMRPDAYMWSSIIMAYARHGQPTQAIRLYQKMRVATAGKPDNHVFVAVLKACAIARDLAAGKEVHAHVRASAVKPDIFVETCLVDMYAKCGSLQDALEVFNRLPRRGVVTWNAMIAGYAQQGMGHEALRLYRSMQQEGITTPDSVTFVCLLQACASLGASALHQGKQLHAQIEGRGLQADMVVGNSLVNMYAKCSSLENAQRVFDKLSQKDVVTWTAMIAGYAQQGLGEEALRLYNCMQQEGITHPSSATFVCLLQACASVGVPALDQGKQLHAQVEEQGMQSDVVVGSSLVNMYAKCGSLEGAQRVFDRLPQKNVVTWTTMIAGYAQQGKGHQALSLYSCMQQDGITPPDSVTFSCLLQACASVGLAALPQGKQLHLQIEERGLEVDVVVGGSLVNMYAKCGSLETAQRVFDRLPQKNVVTWTAMVAGYVQHGLGQEALCLYNHMQQERITPPNSVTFACLLQACASVGVGALHQGKQLHAQIEEQGLQADVVVSNNLVNMYSKCGSLEDARRLFDRLPQKDVVTWTAMIAAFAQHGMGQEALSLYSSMQQEGISTPDSVTFVCLLQACASVAALPLGKQLHAQIEELGLVTDVVVGPSLVHMYAKCGSLEDAQQIFDSLPERDVVSWGALIAGYARQGDSKVVFDLVTRMKRDGIQPNSLTFSSVLTVCSHGGLLDEGRKYFNAMSTDYGISATIEHYSCMVDLLGRAGQLDEALQMVQTMPFRPDGAVWLTLLSACRKWNSVEVGRQVFEFAVRLDEQEAAAYVLMSSIYATAQMWEEAKEIQARRLKCGAWKQPGQSWWTDMDGVVHSFVVGNKKHLESCVDGCQRV